LKVELVKVLSGTDYLTLVHNSGDIFGDPFGDPFGGKGIQYPHEWGIIGQS
jgi:hypothetical protein